MAEFMEVIKQTVRMCREHERCDGCPMKTFARGGCPFYGFVYRARASEDIERVVMAWAAEHPELKYPSWKEAWKRLFPNAMSIPCPINHFGADIQTVCDGRCEMCKSRPITAEIAEKLGIEPVEDNNEQDRNGD